VRAGPLASKTCFFWESLQSPVEALGPNHLVFWRKYDTGVRTPLRFQRAWTSSRVQTVAIRSPRSARIARPTLRINEFLLTPRADGAPTIPNRNNQAK
jgi:hypothetical protein